MSQIVIGNAGKRNVSIDLDVLLATRLLIQANSGGGKSWLLRRLAEQLYGKVPVIIIDPEGEFASLREKFDYFLVGEGGDTPAHERSASLLAETLLKLRANAVCDLYETFRKNPIGRHLWVKTFLGGLLDAPKSLWRPTVVIVDEAHVFCPEKGESPAEGVMVGLATAGRKRHFCPIWATQRLALLQKDGSSQLQNRMVGLTFEDVDVDRAAALLSVGKDEIHDFKKQVKTLDPGNFFAFGRAISKERILVHVGPVETSHEAETGKAGAMEPPPPPEKIKALLPKLADLPRTAEEKAKTEAELRGEIRSLKAQLRGAPVHKVQPADARSAADARAIERTAQAQRDLVWNEHFDRLASKFEEAEEAIRKIAADASQAAMFAKHYRSSLSILRPKKIPSGAVQKGGPIPEAISSTGPARHPAPNPRPDVSPRVSREESNGDSKLQRPQLRILRALSELRAIGKDTAQREMVAGWAGYSPGSGGFNNPLGNLRSLGLVSYPQEGFVALTAEGMGHVEELPPPTEDEVQRRILSVCDGPERKILSALMQHHLEAIPRNQLAEESGYTPDSGGFNNPMGALNTKGFVSYPQKGYVRCSDWLFLE